MAKATKTGNTAVAGITAASTTSPTTSLKEKNTSSGTGTSTKTGTAKSSASGSGSSTNKSTSSTKSTSSSSTANKTAGSTAGASDSAAAGVLEEQEPSYADKFYAALANIGAHGDGTVYPSATQTRPQVLASEAVNNIVSGAKGNIPNTNIAPIDYVDIAQQRAELKAREANEKAQAELAADYAVSQGVNELSRNLQDSRGLYQTQRDQIDADEAKALDNQVLYAEARGDRGGIGQAQYGAIQNTAAKNRASVNAAEVKLQNDTARQIADLRAHGEFEKADKVLSISNAYLKELQDLEKWAKEKNVSVQEFNAKLSEWQKEYALNVGKYLTDAELQAAKLAGAFANGAETADYRNAVENRYANSGKAMISAGIVPSASQLEAMGWSPEQYWIYKMANANGG